MFRIQRCKLEGMMKSRRSKQSVKKAYAMTQMKAHIPRELYVKCLRLRTRGDSYASPE
jgi:hypothetical protein